MCAAVRLRRGRSHVYAREPSLLPGGKSLNTAEASLAIMTLREYQCELLLWQRNAVLMQREVKVHEHNKRESINVVWSSSTDLESAHGGS